MEFTFDFLCRFWLGAGVLMTVLEFVVPGFIKTVSTVIETTKE